MPTNRISPISLWPSDPLDVIKRADRDLDFCDVMEELGFNVDPSLLAVKGMAFQKRTAAQKRLVREKGE